MWHSELSTIGLNLPLPTPLLLPPTSPSGLSTFLYRPEVSCFSINHISHLFKPHSDVTYSRKLSLITLQEASAQTHRHKIHPYIHANEPSNNKYYIDTNTKKSHNMFSAFYPALVSQGYSSTSFLESLLCAE